MRLEFRNVWMVCALAGSFFSCKKAPSGTSPSADDWVSQIRETLTGQADPEGKGGANPSGNGKTGGTGSKGRISKTDFDRKYEAAQERAVREFPELGVAGSLFNAEFLARVKALKAEDIRYFSNPEWPYDLAKRVQEVLNSRVDKKTVSTLLVSQRPSLYLGQTVTAVGTLVRATGGSIAGPVALDLEGGLRAEVDPEQIVRKKGNSISEWNSRTYKVSPTESGLVFFQSKQNAWLELFVLAPGALVTVKGQVTRFGDKVMIKTADLVDWRDQQR
jgi:ribosomal protein L15